MKYHSSRIFLYLSITLFCSCSCISTATTSFIRMPNENGTVYTGKVTKSTFGNTTYTTAKFLGIPYAKPPTGERRFSKPELVKLNDTYSATESKNICYQKINPKDGCQAFGSMSEDCLFLNIYVPIPQMSTTASNTQTSSATVEHETTDAQFTTVVRDDANETDTTATEASKTEPTTTDGDKETDTTATYVAKETGTTATEATKTEPTTTGGAKETGTTATEATKTEPTTTGGAKETDTTSTYGAKETGTTATEAIKTEPTATAPTTIVISSLSPVSTEPNTEKPSTETKSNETAQQETVQSDGSSGQEDGVDEVGETLTLLRNRKLAVLIYIHGGAYFEGNANCYDGSKLASFGDIIVVTINYRLGPLGFLTTDDETIPGNLGLWDQHLAIKWVKENIESFGGDATRITVGGQSAGSYSSLLQALSPQNVGLFQRVIAQSGSPFAKNSVIHKGYKTAIEVAKQLGCPAQSLGNSSAIKDCLMKINASDLVKADLPNSIPSSLPLEPTLDGTLITDDPHQELSANSKPKTPFTNVDLLIGFDADDGEVVYRLWALLNAKKFNITLLNGALNQPIPMNIARQIVFEYLAESFEENIESYKSIIDAVVDRYLDWERSDDVNAISNRVVAVLTDVFFVLPVAEAALAHNRDLEDVPNTPTPTNFELNSTNGGNNKLVADVRGRTYVYKFKLPKTDANFQSKWIPWFNGTNHAAEIRYVFGNVATPEDIDLSSVVMTYWSNFVKNGNPNLVSEPAQPLKDASLSPVEWPSFTRDQQSFLEISTQPKQRNHLGSAARHFWYDLVPSLRKDMEARFEAGVKSAKTQNSGNQQCNHGTQSRLAVKTWILLSTAVLVFNRCKIFIR